MTEDVSRGTEFPIPQETRIITVANQKGGVGKTTSTVNLAAALAKSGLQVLVIDLDPQGNASTALAIPHHKGVPDIYAVLVGAMAIEEVVQSVPHTPNLWCVPATIDLAGAETELVPLMSREGVLARALKTYLDDHVKNTGRRLDYVFIDCPPSLGLLTINAFSAAKEVLVPIQCEYYALEGLSQLGNIVDMVRLNVNGQLRITTMLMTMFDGRTRLAQDVVDDVRRRFPDLTLKTLIPRSVRLSEAPSQDQTVLNYDPDSVGALAYIAAASELANRGAYVSQ